MKNTWKHIIAASALVLTACATEKSESSVGSSILNTNETGESIAAFPTSGFKAFQVLDAFGANRLLTRTMNYTGLEAPNEGDWGPKLEEAGFEAIKQAGFTAIRLPVKYSNHAAKTAPYRIDPAFVYRIDWAIRNATKRGLAIIVDMHHYDELMTDPVANKARFLGLWSQIATRYKNQYGNVMFELHNEPNDKLEPLWNQYMTEALAVVRKTNPTRNVIVGPNRFNNADRLWELKLPNDPNLIVTFHNYTPFEFTHQGATWVTQTPPVGTVWPAPGVVLSWENWSWDSMVTATTAGIDVTYNKAWAGAYLHSDSPASGFSSLRLKTDRAVKLLISCFNNVNGAQSKAFPLQTQAGIVQSVPLSSCGTGEAFQDLQIQNGEPAAQAKFTFQTLELVGATGSRGFLTDAQGEVRNYLDVAANWAKANNRPMFMGEFGAFEMADLASRVRWTTFTRAETEKRGISWAYWDFNGSFGAWNPVTKLWKNDLLNALIAK
jgi:endoglucanase